MALAPTAVASPAPADEGAMPPPDAELDAGNADEGTEPECIATICRNKDGTYMLYAGDEPDAGEPGMAPGGDEPAPEGQTFDTPQALLRGVMELLNNSGAAEDSFAKGFKGEPDATAMKPAERMPPGPRA